MSDCRENLRYKLSLNIKYELLLWKFNAMNRVGTLNMTNCMKILCCELRLNENFHYDLSLNVKYEQNAVKIYATNSI